MTDAHLAAVVFVLIGFGFTAVTMIVAYYYSENHPL